MMASSVTRGYDSSVSLHQSLSLQELINRLYRLTATAQVAGQLNEKIELRNYSSDCRRIDHKRAQRLIYIDTEGREFMIVHETDDAPHRCGHVTHGDYNGFKVILLSAETGNEHIHRGLAEKLAERIRRAS